MHYIMANQLENVESCIRKSFGKSFCLLSCGI